MEAIKALTEIAGGLGALFLIALLVVTGILWVFVPFYISSMNKKLRDLIGITGDLANTVKRLELIGKQLNKSQPTKIDLAKYN